MDIVKNLEFDLADFGIIGLETTFSVINTFGNLSIEKIIEKLTTNPRKLLRLEKISIKEGNPANLSIFDPDQVWIYESKNIQSKSKNSPFIDKKLRGKIKAVINKGKIFINN